ncbi:purine-binding chemotaxis protein CheW [Gammaproteobacteria bacterium]
MGRLVPLASSKAAVPKDSIEDDNQQQFLTFSVGGELFAVGILNVKEIIEFGNLTQIPMMPPFIRGVINLRGSVVPVIDLAARFGGKPAEISRRTCIVIIEIQGEDVDHHDIGVVVDGVNEVLEIPVNAIEPAPTFGAKIRTDFIRGMGKVGNRFVIILNIDQVLSMNELTQLMGVASAVWSGQEPGMAVPAVG